MRLPEQKPEDLFYAIGFTIQDAAQKAQILLQMEKERLASLKRSETGELIEIYFLDVVSSDLLEKMHGDKYLALEYWNEAAFSLAQKIKIHLPPVIEKLMRAKLPPSPPLGRSMFQPYTP